MIRKGFPIHMSRTLQTIRILCLHECSKMCKYRTVQTFDDDLNMSITLNPTNERCPHKGTSTSGHIRLSTFSIQSPLCLSGPLLQPNTLVIRDTQISVYLDYPLTIPCIEIVTSPFEEGFRLAHLIDSIRSIYTRIYKEELETATEKTYTLHIPCKKCVVQPVNSEPSDPSKEDCSICCQELDNDVCKTSCNHTFHKRCIVSWSRHGDKCPICRDDLAKCDTCNGSKMTTIQWSGKVIPPEYRIFRPRNKTDGKWGIHTADFENLILTGLEYNHREKMLYVAFSK